MEMAVIVVESCLTVKLKRFTCVKSLKIIKNFKR